MKGVYCHEFFLRCGGRRSTESKTCEVKRGGIVTIRVKRRVDNGWWDFFGGDGGDKCVTSRGINGALMDGNVWYVGCAIGGDAREIVDSAEEGVGVCHRKGDGD